MMRKMILAICFACSAWSAQAAFVPGREPEWMKVASAPTKMAQQRNPDPFNVAQQPTNTVTVPPPAVNVTLPPQAATTLDYIWAAIAGIFTALFGVNIGMNRPKNVGDLLNNPDLLHVIEGVVLKVVQSGAPGAAIQTVGGTTPFGGIISMVEPQIRALVIKALQDSLAKATAPTS